MFRDEIPMLDMRLEECQPFDELVHVICEAPWTHRGVPKPLTFAAQRHAYHPGLRSGRIRHVIDDWDPDVLPWNNEHHQRNRAWKVIAAEAADDDPVLICDVDEIPSGELLRYLARGDLRDFSPLAIPMRTYLFAVDWEVARRVPPTCVAATAGYLRKHAARGRYLAEIRDDRDLYPEFQGHGGWHFSWCGGPAAQAAKLDTATCHTEILATAEADLIRSGARWATSENGGGLPVRPVTVDSSWPAKIREGRCPPEWFRPRTPHPDLVRTLTRPF
jgi:hypothetical protein